VEEFRQLMPLVTCVGDSGTPGLQTKNLNPRVLCVMVIVQQFAVDVRSHIQKTNHSFVLAMN